jgi:hypothetical protein
MMEEETIRDVIKELEKSTYWLMQSMGHKLKVKVCKLVVEPLKKL